MSKENRNKLIRELLKNSDEKFDDEELIHLLLEEKISTNENEKDDKPSFGQRAADSVAKFAGSWLFIFSFLIVMMIWMMINVLLRTKAFDSYPFILLNLVLSCVAAIQAPFIMMSQNRQESKDRQRAENGYRVNLKNELVIDDLHRKLDAVLENQKKLETLLKENGIVKQDKNENTKQSETVKKD